MEKIELMEIKLNKRRIVFSILIMIATTSTLVTVIISSFNIFEPIMKSNNHVLIIGNYLYYFKIMVQFILSIVLVYNILQNREVNRVALVLFILIFIPYRIADVEFVSLSLSLNFFLSFNLIGIGINAMAFVLLIFYRSYRSVLHDYKIEKQNKYINDNI